MKHDQDNDQETSTPRGLSAGVIVTFIITGIACVATLMGFDFDFGVGSDAPKPWQNRQVTSTITTKCDHGNLLYVATRSDGTYSIVAVIPKDPTCSQ